ncbi:gliding motility-associated-like protein [Chryseobacterium bernardetii]|uniref:Gliding motility-associated-like protein n=2 Tax=Chryseobacterium TaxID=59732 RepID=A0A543EC88_9FLAO|nr:MULTISPECIES: T9SS type B sorting domain-containing protein [Chryseobacterium]MDR6372606.1 gliding motility-associated-like protein [Chryseobacterium vietnamense]MDR6442824.1 gliding motility-associated-like protein [Chryseobacterium bernardetii]TQM19200.1 gliding motility-associated-like protein [Chryseobacterium aquifrigidense]
MKKNILIFLLTILLCLPGRFLSQTYQLTGNPVNTTGWDLVSDAIVSGDFVRLTTDQTSRYGAVKLSTPITLSYCDKWKVEFDFRIDGNGTTQFGKGDGFTFWYLANPPTGFVSGGGLGIPANASGLMVGFDIFNNTTEGQMSKVHILYGTNNTAGNNIEFNTTPGSTFHSPDLIATQPFVGDTYRHVEVNGETDLTNPTNWIIKVRINGVLIVDQSFAPSGGAVGMSQGYFGFSAATGGASARHSIKDVKVYVDKVPILSNTISPFVCTNPATGNGTVDLTSYNSQFVNNPGNYIFTYYVLGSSTPIANPTSFQYSGNTTIKVVVKDPTSTLCDNGDGVIQLNPTPFAATDASLSGCNNNNAGTATFDLNTAAVTTVAGVTKEFYPTLYDLNNGTNQITNPSAYASAAATIYVKVTTPQGCVSTSKITLNIYPVVVVNDVEIKSCFIETNPSTASFNLTGAVVSQGGLTKEYYPSLTDAISGTNAIATPTAYIAPNGVVYIKVFNGNGCYSIAKVTLTVIPPVYSRTLLDKTICIENTTTLDAGAGFKSYEWSTGATTQSIKNVGVGTYWVKLKTGDCIVTQKVTVYPSDNPVITTVDISGSTVTVYANGGTPPYQYSMDNINWQDSNVFTNIARGEAKVYVRDGYNCVPVEVNITVPNLINIITPNDDGINDFVDYSALANKQNLEIAIFDRYGYKMFQADKTNGYKWAGTTNGHKKVPTGNYWYSVSWNENNKNSTPIKFSGWIVVKNRE